MDLREKAIRWLGALENSCKANQILVMTQALKSVRSGALEEAANAIELIDVVDTNWNPQQVHADCLSAVLKLKE